MKTTYKITPAHSGTDLKEIEKAKRHFRKMVTNNDLYNQITQQINIRFTDTNYRIIASFYNVAGHELCDSVLIFSVK